jgi:hypothetical protein
MTKRVLAEIDTVFILCDTSSPRPEKRGEMAHTTDAPLAVFQALFPFFRIVNIAVTKERSVWIEIGKKSRNPNTKLDDTYPFF